MTVTKYIFYLCFILLFSCKTNSSDFNIEENKKEKNTYEIFSYLINLNIEKNDSYLNPFFQSTKNYSVKDSLWKYKFYYQEKNRRKKISIEPKTSIIINEKIDLINECKLEKKSIQELESLNSLEKKLKIDLEKVFLLKKDSLIYFDNTKSNYEKYSNVDLIFNFPKVIFNKSYNKALVFIGISTGKLSGVGLVYILEKNNYFWKVKCELGLTIS
jgi:hypothetical protein